jgi:aspartyl/asparaginyl-tRNA synthetase
MSMVTTIERLGKHVGETVELRGWIHNKSSKGKLHFVQLRDGTGFVQCVLFKNDVSDELFDAVGHAGQESSLILEGVVKAEPRAPGGFEIGVKDGRVLQKVEGYPITPKEHGPDFLLSNRHLWLRSKRQWAVMRIRDCVITSIRRFYEEIGFTCVDSPIFTPAACEGTSTLFEVNYFDDEKAYLTQSGQLYAEASAMALGKVYCFGPTFRAEKSKTRRHLTEFWMLEPEIAFATLDDVMQHAEDLLCYVVKKVLEKRQTELAALERDQKKLEAIVPPFPRLSYDEAHAMLESGARSAQARRRLRRARRDHLEQRLRSPGDGAPLSAGGESLLHEARPRGSDEGVVRRRARARGDRRDHRRQPARRRSRCARRSHPTARVAGGSVRLVPGPAQVRQRAARRVRARVGADSRLDLRPRARARSESLPADDVPHLSLSGRQA